MDFRGFDSSLNSKGWNYHVHRGVPGKFESSNLSRDNARREIWRAERCARARREVAAAGHLGRHYLSNATCLTRIRIYVSLSLSLYIYVYTYICIHTHTCITDMYTYTNIYVYIYAYIGVYIYIYIHTYIYIYICAYTY